MKKKLLKLCIIAGILCLFASILGFYQVNNVKTHASRYSDMEGVPKSEKNMWTSLNKRGCGVIMAKEACYCAKSDNVDDCVQEYLTNPPKGYNDDLYVFAKYRYILIVISLGCFIGAWVFHEKKEKNRKEEN